MTGVDSAVSLISLQNYRIHIANIESKTTSGIIESKQSQALDSGDVCARSVRLDSLRTSDSQVLP